MTAYNLFVRRLCVFTQQGQVAYDEHFHQGINIIRGDNSSGKSTITHLLFYALGGDFTRFVAEVRHCSRVLVEVTLGDAVVTLERPLEQDDAGRMKPRRGMIVHWGTMDEATEQRCQSLSLGYATTTGRQGFSSVLFRLMGIPMVQAESNITMHQLLRLLYLDQESPTSSLYLYEQFDQQLTRETIADLLMGIYDATLYDARTTLRTLQQDIDELRATQRALEATLPQEHRSSAQVDALIRERQTEIDQWKQDIAQLRAGESVASPRKMLLEQKKSQVTTLARQCKQAADEVDLLAHEVEDTELYIEELRYRRDALERSTALRHALDSMPLTCCPECLSPLSAQMPQGTCRLCGTAVDESLERTHMRREMEAIVLQIQESESEQKRDRQQLALLKGRLGTLRRQSRNAQRELDDLIGTARSTQAARIEDLTYRCGCAQGELLQYYTLRETVGRYEELKRQLNHLTTQRSATERDIQEREACQQSRRAAVIASMQKHGTYFLRHDQECQRAFANARPEDFHVDFSGNLVYLNQPHARYSASSTFFLKLVARFSLFFASLDIPQMRYPHFILADNMEDKGIEVARAQKFQETLIARLRKYPVSTYQVIYTTSYITPSLDHSPYVVGQHYRVNHKSLLL